MHPSFPALLELEIARREAELHHDRVSAPLRVRLPIRRQRHRHAARRLRPVRS